MIIAVIAVGMVQMSIDQVIHVIAVGDRGMATARTMDMPGPVATATMLGRAPVGVLAVHLDHVLVHVSGMGMMEVPIMQVIRVTAVLDRDMAATLAVLVGMIRMSFAGTAHNS